MEGFTQVIMELREMNANIVQKGDQSLRLDAVVEVSSRQLYEVLIKQDKYERWFMN